MNCCSETTPQKLLLRSNIHPSGGEETPIAVEGRGDSRRTSFPPTELDRHGRQNSMMTVSRSREWTPDRSATGSKMNARDLTVWQRLEFATVDYRIWGSDTRLTDLVGRWPNLGHYSSCTLPAAPTQITTGRGLVAKMIQQGILSLERRWCSGARPDGGVAAEPGATAVRWVHLRHELIHLRPCTVVRWPHRGQRIRHSLFRRTLCREACLGSRA